MPPLVSICCVTYHHASTIAQALDSFLAQQGDVSIEILVHDDHSTDGTEEILREYAQRYPDVVKPLFETENQYQKGIAMDATFNFPRAKGRYIALCEGDDYWCDPHKLLAQTAYLDAHPECTFCFTNGYIQDASGANARRKFVPYYPEEAAYFTPATRTYDLAEITKLSFIPTASFIFPREALLRIPRAALIQPCPTGDLRLKLLLTAMGSAAYLHAFTCVYRQNGAGSEMTGWGGEAGAKTRKRCERVVAMLRSVDEVSKRSAHDALQSLVDKEYRVMLEAAPSRALLRDADAKRVYRALPLARRLKFHVKRLIPETLYRFMRRGLSRK